MTDAPDDWPVTIRVAGREYVADPTMSMAEYTEMTQALANETEKVIALADALGMRDAIDYDEDDHD